MAILPEAPTENQKSVSKTLRSFQLRFLLKPSNHPWSKTETSESRLPNLPIVLRSQTLRAPFKRAFLTGQIGWLKNGALAGNHWWLDWKEAHNEKASDMPQKPLFSDVSQESQQLNHCASSKPPPSFSTTTIGSHCSYHIRILDEIQTH